MTVRTLLRVVRTVSPALAVLFTNGCLLIGDGFDGLEPIARPSDAGANSGPGGSANGANTGSGGTPANGASTGSGGALSGGRAGVSGAGGTDASVGAGGATGGAGASGGFAGTGGAGNASGGSPGGGGRDGGSGGLPDAGGHGGGSVGSRDADADAPTGGSGGCGPTGCDYLMDVEPWADHVCLAGETCLLGDVNNDGKDDAIALVRDTQEGGLANEVWVALTNPSGTGFLPSTRWSEYFCRAGEDCIVADVDGDGRDDLVAFTRDSLAEPERNDVWVALSTGSSFAERQKWSDDFCSAGMECFAADVTADGKADLVGFVKGSRPQPEANDVLVALSSGGGFGPAEKWSDFHCIGNETCAVGDVDGDGRADVVSFVRETQVGQAARDVWVRLALPGGGFAGNAIKWSDDFCEAPDKCVVSDMTGDGRADAVAFTRYRTGWQLPSLGTQFGVPNMLASYICAPGEVCLVGDVTGDGLSDLVAFIRDSNPTYAGHAFVVRSWGSSWRALSQAPALASSATLLRSDEILITAGGQNNCCRGTEPKNWGFDHSYLYNPINDRWDQIASPYGATTDAFSAGHAHDSDGNVVYYGGSVGVGGATGPSDGGSGPAPTSLLGIADSARWDVNTRTWTALAGTPPLWSPTMVPGRGTSGAWNLFLLGGAVDWPASTPDSGAYVIAQRLGSTDMGWTSTGNVLQMLAQRPRAFLLPDGKIFVASPRTGDLVNLLYDPALNQVSSAGDDVVPHSPNYDGFVNPAVLLPIQADANQKYSSVRVMHIGGGRAFVKELGGPAPGPWYEPAPLRSRVIDFSPLNADYANATLLPTGQVVVTGGTAGAKDSTMSAFQAEVFGEDTGGAALNDKWSWASGTQVRRHRHSVALLLRDGRVWVAGSSYDGIGSFCNDQLVCTVPGSDDDRNLYVETFEPWYYGRPDRPTITACPATFAGVPATRDISVGNDEGEGIMKVSLMAPGSVTQSFNSDQRLIWLDIVAKTASTVTVNIPYTEAAAPPGDYMVFVLKRNPRPNAPLIPSIGCWTKR